MMSRGMRAVIWPLMMTLHDPIRTSFGAMINRPLLFLQLIDEDGIEGWGESWVNFPSWALEERTLVLHHLLENYLGLLNDADSIESIIRRYRTEAIQSGGMGAFYHAVSAIEVALWDLDAHRRQVPLRTLLSGTDSVVSAVGVYASGIGPERIQERVEQAVGNGFHSVKVKVGFDTSQDHSNFRLAQSVSGVRHVMVDANQAWSRDAASEELAYYQSSGAEWVEEPISAMDVPGYYALSQRYSNLAAGENWYTDQLFSRNRVHLKAIQPDICKIGGIRQAQRLVDNAVIEADFVTFHVLGGPIAHAVSLQVAAAWGNRVNWVEFDTNENPVRDAVELNWTISDGKAILSLDHGLGVRVDTSKLESFVSDNLRSYHEVVMTANVGAGEMMERVTDVAEAISLTRGTRG